MALFGQSRLMGYLWACGDPDAGGVRAGDCRPDQVTMRAGMVIGRLLMWA